MGNLTSVHLAAGLCVTSQLILLLVLSLLLAHTRCVDTPASAAKFSPHAHKQQLWTQGCIHWQEGEREGEDFPGAGAGGPLWKRMRGAWCSEHSLEGVKALGGHFPRSCGRTASKKGHG